MTMIDYVEGLLEELEYYDSAHKLEDYENLERQEIQNELEGILMITKRNVKMKVVILKKRLRRLRNG